MASHFKTLIFTSPSNNPSNSPSNTIKFLCSYGGKILPRPSDGRLRYVGGLTRVISVNRSVTFSELMAKLENLCGYSVSLRCQLPSEDLDVLVSIKSSDDLLNVIEEYDKASLISGRELKIRAILTTAKSRSPSSSMVTSLSSSSSNSDLSPLTGTLTGENQRRFVNQKPPLAVAASRRNSPARRGQQYGVVRDCYYYYPCHFQANYQPSYLLQHSNRSH